MKTARLYPRTLALILSGAMVATILAIATAALSDEKHHKPDGELQDVALGQIDMKNPMMRARRFTFPPGAKSPTHRHDGPGIRYVLEGEITIYWKDSTKHTYGPGDTYFEGPGENHPPHDMAAANEGDKPVTVLIVDLHPGE
ncbi:MAG TPA: cupin domain-containing protein [Sneathiellales bacterium]|nr:cupin domain-containing protein [Sneathiellales bacterium]